MLLTCVLLMAAACRSDPSGVEAAAAGASRPGGDSSDEFLIVDCALPGQIRQLGAQVTYLSRRPAIKTSARDCQIRGGEYVAYDRSTYASALQVWLPKAEDGDAKAQTYVGEIYEKGLGLKPDYAVAADWYRRAADQNYGPAEINLGSLYEQGLGVRRDPKQALVLYRRASGLDEKGLQFVSAEDKAETRRLQSDLAQQTKATQQARGELSHVRHELDATRARLGRQETLAGREGESLAGAREELAAREAALAADRTRLQAEQERLRGLEAEIVRLSDAQRQAPPLATTTSDAERRRFEDLEKDAHSVRQEADRLRADLGRQQDTIRRQEQAVASQQREIAAKQAEIDRLNTEIATLKRDADARQATVSESGKNTQLAAGDLPVIEMIDPTVPATRGSAVVTLRAALPEKQLIGRVTSRAGLMSLSINDQAVSLDANNLFHTEVPVARAGTDVDVVAIDKQGGRSTLSFTLKPGGAVETAARGNDATVTAVPSGIDFGNYYALVIGNNAYARLPKLETAVADADAIGTILKQKYGFKVTTLVNANRYDILSALNKMRENLTEKDNLLIYYAGHGDLDRVNQRGYWLPVDAEPDSTANWISNIQITDILNAMSTKHVLVIADSCYSGALTRSALARLEAGMSPEARQTWLATMVNQRSRTALTSGGVAPVIDNIGGRHSVFAKALIDVLQENPDGVLEGQRLFRDVAARVTYAAQAYGVEQVPEYAPIRFAGHSGGDFFFVERG